jgi:hypothetical protein
MFFVIKSINASRKNLTMKKIFSFLVIALTLATTSAFAQNGSRMQQMQQQYLKDSVHLSDAMVDSVMAIRTSYRPQMREIFTDQSLSDTDKQSKMQTIRSEMEAKYKTLGISDEQITMMREHDQRMREQMRNRGSGGGVGNGQ